MGFSNGATTGFAHIDNRLISGVNKPPVVEAVTAVAPGIDRLQPRLAQLNLHLCSGQTQEASTALRDVLNRARNLEVIKPRHEALQATAEFFAALGDPRCLRLFSFVEHHLGATDMLRTSTRMRQLQLSDPFDSTGGSAEASESSHLELNTVLGELAKEFW